MIEYSSHGINKRMVNMLILRILEEYSDDDHSLTQQEILRRLKAEYDVDCDRRTVKSNIEYLNEMGYDISMEGGYRLLSRDFEESELRMLIDSVLSSRSIPVSQARNLVRKLESMGSVYFVSRVSHVRNLPDRQYSDNKQVLYSVGIINDAIDEKKMIRFTYKRYGTDLKLHPARRNPREVTPYEMVAGNGRYYMLCYEEYREEMCYYRIDRMTDVAVLENKKAKKLKDIPGMERGLRHPQHMAENFYMFSGESIPIVIRAKTAMVGDLVDWFGKSITILESDEEYVKVRVSCNENSAFFWALQYGQSAEILWPESLRQRLRTALQEMTERYERDPGMETAPADPGDAGAEDPEETQEEAAAEDAPGTEDAHEDPADQEDPAAE